MNLILLLSTTLFGLIYWALTHFKNPTQRSLSNPLLKYLVQFTVFLGMSISIAFLMVEESVLEIIYAQVISITAFAIWAIGIIRVIYSKLSVAKPTRTVIVVGIVLTLTYGSLAVTNHAPNPENIPAWFQEQHLLTQQGFRIFASLLLAILCYSLFTELMKFATKSETLVDDILFIHFRFPIAFTVFFQGLVLAIDNSPFSESTMFLFSSIVNTSLLGVWTWSLAKLSTELLVEMQSSTDRWLLINTRTLPIYQLIIRIILAASAFYFLLVAWGKDPTAWLASAGLVGVALAYASQDTLSSLFAGVAILSDSPYKIGDILVLDNKEQAKVTQIGFRSTRMVTINNVELVIPNALLANARVTNLSGSDNLMRIEVPVSIAYGSDLELARNVIIGSIQEISEVLDHPAPALHFSAMGASSLDFTLRVWINNPEIRFPVLDKLNTNIYSALIESDIEIPYTKQDVYLHTVNET